MSSHDYLTTPKSGTIWIKLADWHAYVVLYMANDDESAEYPLTVVYQGADGKVWTMPMSEWNPSMEKLQYKKKGPKPAICTECLVNYSDPPSPLCPGCEAYKDHQR